MSDQEKKLDAAEYVIGTLSAVERSAFEASIESDASTKADVLFWERAFGALNASVSPQAPPEDMWDRVVGQLPAETGEGEPTVAAPTVSRNVAANDNIAEKLRRSRGRWRMGTIAATIAALGLGAFILNERTGFVEQNGTQIAGVSGAKQYIAVVNANGDQPSLVINVNAETGDVTVRSVGVARPEGKSLELWYVPDGQKAVSVGLVGESGIDLKDISAKSGDLFAISLEPQGGSPTGVATGPVIYTGKLIENPDGK